VFGSMSPAEQRGWHVANRHALPKLAVMLVLTLGADAESTIELFGKTVIRTAVHVPSGMLHRDPPTETGYEFFLLRRSQATRAATIIQRWVVQPADVVKDRSGYPRAWAVLKYDASAQVAAVSITGLKKPVNDRVDVSASRAAR
jgi:hypothetical protein